MENYFDSNAGIDSFQDMSFPAQHYHLVCNILLFCLLTADVDQEWPKLEQTLPAEKTREASRQTTAQSTASPTCTIVVLGAQRPLVIFLSFLNQGVPTVISMHASIRCGSERHPANKGVHMGGRDTST